MVSWRNCARLLPLLLVVVNFVTRGAESEKLEFTGVRKVENEESKSYDNIQTEPQKSNDEVEAEEIKSTSKSWRTSSRQISQRQMLRLLRERTRRQLDDSVERVDDSTSSDHPSSASEGIDKGATDEEVRRERFQEKVESTQAKTEFDIPPEQLADFVEKLPGQPKVEFAQYAGYVTVNETAGRALFYWFSEATSSPESKPLVLWLNGGPGCSSLGNGAFEELGPFRVKSDGKTLYRNHYAWNKVANFLFLESPAGVGFSYSNTSSDYATSGDTKTAADSLTFLIKWFERFPQYTCREFYIAGESYAGNYIPQLAKVLYDYNKKLSKPSINLKGFMVGNGVIDNDQDNRGIVDYWWSHALISDETYMQLQKCGRMSLTYSTCDNTLNGAFNEQGNIDPYDIYTPVCLTNATTLNRHNKVGYRIKGYDPCLDNYVTTYFNRPDVQKALHANVTHVSFPWASCSDFINENYGDIALSVIPIYKEFIKTDLKIWVYSGDVDSVVPVLSTRYSLLLLKLNTTVPWSPWYRNHQVGGYSQGYDGLTFVTVRGAGHEVPLFQPARALSLITSYITGVPLPTS